MFLYFLGGRKSVNSQIASQIGLNHLPDRVASREVCVGPAGLSGCVFGGVDAQKLKYDAELQKWRKVKSDHDLFVGFWTSDPPTPKLLCRPMQREGKELRLLDGNAWKIPMLRQWRDSEGRISYASTLPRLLDVDESGETIYGSVVPQYRDVWEAGERVADDVFNQLIGAGKASLSDGDCLDFVAKVVGVNYFVSFPELALLGCLSPTECREIINIAIDEEGLRASLKNLESRLSGGTDTKAGGERLTEAQTTSTPTDQR